MGERSGRRARGSCGANRPSPQTVREKKTGADGQQASARRHARRAASDAPTDLSQTRPSSTICPRKARSSKPRSRYPGPLRPQSGSGQSSHRAILGRSLPAGRKPRASHSALRNVFQAAGNRTRKADAASRPKGSLLLRFQQQSGTFCIEHGGSAVKPPLTEASPFRCKGFRLANGLDGPRREAKESRREKIR